MDQYFIHCDGQMIFHHVALPHFAYPFNHSWIFVLFPRFAIMNPALKSWVQAFEWTYDFSYLGTYLGIKLLGHIVTVYFAS